MKWGGFLIFGIRAILVSFLRHYHFLSTQLFFTLGQGVLKLFTFNFLVEDRLI
ncbi:hypothetical protein JBKA6_0325 [Ichthyobacterium seriolicida]|uniref:Uncharacterized protein n=1 Tax=Ichthyobacterium seriolicida TaxID=242600 RepID=A0A1J1DWV3_9FLAO|nr:hypothetical protein JBKA6_0325 [Ichthyobacterium seriolicida]